jgi:hypothetical protein
MAPVAATPASHAHHRSLSAVNPAWQAFVVAGMAA